MQDDQLFLIPELLERRQSRRKAKHVVQRDEIRVLVRHRSSERLIRRIAIRDDGGEAVEAAAQKDEDEPAGLPHLREADERRAERREAAEAHVSDESPAVHGHLHWKAGPAMASA